jgi:hypothetical protein
MNYRIPVSHLNWAILPAFLAVVLAGASGAWAQIETFTFVQGENGYQGFDDTTLFSESDNSGGGNDGIFSGTINRPSNNLPHRRALLRLDLLSIPEGGIVQSVSLQMRVSSSGGGFGDIDYTLHQVSNRWGEGTVVGALQGGFGGPAQSGDATWNQNEFGISSWANPGGDFVPSASATAAAGLAGTMVTWSDAGMIGDVQAWINTPETNFGWIVISTIEGEQQRVKKFHSSEATAFRPVVTILVDTMPSEGEGEGEELLCDVLAEITMQWENFRADFSIADDDVDMDGLPEEAILLLLDAVCTMEPRAGLSAAVSHAYDINLAELDLESDSVALAPYRKALAALFSTSVRIRQILTQLIEDFGIQLAGTYEAVTEVDGSFLPVPTQLDNGAAGFLVANGAAKAIDEPFSGTGDLDGDDESNADEYDRVVTQGGGTVEDFASAAADSGNTADPPDGGTCAAVPGGTGTPNPMDVAALLSVALALGWIGRRRATIDRVETRRESSQ